MLKRVAVWAILAALALPALALDADEAKAIRLVRNYRPAGSGPTISQMLTTDVLPLFTKVGDDRVISWSATQWELEWYVVNFTITVHWNDTTMKDTTIYAFAVHPHLGIVAPLGDYAESLWP